DHDGDLDLYVSSYASVEPPPGTETLKLPRDIPGAPNRLYRNNGDGTFTETAKESGTDGGAPRSLGAVFSDVDDDRDVDFVVVNEGSRPLLFSNDRIGTFTESALDLGLETGSRTRGADSADFDRDGSFDFFFTAEGSQLNALFRGPAREGLRPDVLSPGLLSAGVPSARYGAQFVDADNDADLDLLVVTNEEGALVAYYENRPSGFERAGSLSASVEGEGRGLSVADVDSDGDLDFVVGTDRGELALFRNDGGNARAWLTVRAQGLRSNLDGLGAKVEVRAGDASLRREVRSSSGYFSQSDLPLHFGLGDADSADYVRFLWPGGVKQVEMDVRGRTTAAIEELNRKGTSCPILYAWDGEKIRFVTDFLGGSAFGYLLAPGRYNTSDTEETVKMDDFPLA
ncbi:MAG: CRTAC1 family protein, partial [Vicinamibacteria bacterium]